MKLFVPVVSPVDWNTGHIPDCGTWVLIRLIVGFVVQIKTLVRVTKGLVNSEGATGSKSGPF